MICIGNEFKSADEYFQELDEIGILQYIIQQIEFRRPLALVNKLFYKVVCQIDNHCDIYRARLEQEDILLENNLNEELSVYKSIFSSQRIINEIHLNRVYFVEECGKTYKESYYRTLTGFTNFLRMKVPNLKKLTMKSCLITENQLFLILNSLSITFMKELSIVDCGIIYENIKKFPGVAVFPNLEKLDLSGTAYTGIVNQVAPDNVMFSFIQSINKYSTKLTSVSVRGIFSKWINTRNFKLSHLCIQQASPCMIRICDIISQQLYLTSVDILESYIMEDVLNEILHLSGIKILKINLDGISIRGFANICKKKSLEELGLRCSDSCSWIITAFAMTNLNFLKKLYLNIIDLNVNYNSLSRMLNQQIHNIHIVASQYFVIDCIFSSTFMTEIEKCTVELDIGRINKPLIRRYYTEPGILKEFTLINKNSNIIFYNYDLYFILENNKFLEKVRIENFYINEYNFEAIIKHHYHLKELYLLGPKNLSCGFIFDEKYADFIKKYTKNLKIIAINCKKSQLENSNQFSFIIRRSSGKIFRNR